MWVFFRICENDITTKELEYILKVWYKVYLFKSEEIYSVQKSKLLKQPRRL